MTQLLSGIGRPVFKNLATSIPRFRFAEPVSFKVNVDSSEIVSYKYVDGVKVVAGAKQDKREATAVIDIEATSWEALELAIGVESAITASQDLFEMRTRIVPLTTPFEIADPDIGASSGVQVSVVESGGWGKSGPLILLASGNPADGQYRVDATNNKIIFNSAQAGAPIAYTLIKNYENLRTIGKEATANQLKLIGFEGVGYSESNQLTKIVIPKMVRTKSSSLDFGEKTVLQLEYRMLVAPGYADSYYLVEMPANYNPG
jgi:hypothetical protein